jgi:hypothetical protein
MNRFTMFFVLYSIADPGLGVNITHRPSWIYWAMFFRATPRRELGEAQKVVTQINLTGGACHQAIQFGVPDSEVRMQPGVIPFPPVLRSQLFRAKKV